MARCSCFAGRAADREQVSGSSPWHSYLGLHATYLRPMRPWYSIYSECNILNTVQLLFITISQDRSSKIDMSLKNCFTKLLTRSSDQNQSSNLANCSASRTDMLLHSASEFIRRFTAKGSQWNLSAGLPFGGWSCLNEGPLREFACLIRTLVADLRRRGKA